MEGEPKELRDYFELVRMLKRVVRTLKDCYDGSPVPKRSSSGAEREQYARVDDACRQKLHNDRIKSDPLETVMRERPLPPTDSERWRSDLEARTRYDRADEEWKRKREDKEKREAEELRRFHNSLNGDELDYTKTRYLPTEKENDSD